MSHKELTYLSASEALGLFRSRKLSPVELLDAILQRSEDISPLINPFADCYFDEARAAARSAELEYVKPRGSPGHLLGVPLAVKDAVEITGKRSTSGSLLNKEHVSQSTAPHIDRLLKAGANLFARTTCPEFCWLFTTHSKMWGVTRNPWRLDITPGGSSGGSAAALAAGATTIATGSDSTGSIRQPAAQCGVVAYQAPYGRIPMPGENSFSTFVHYGPMSRSVGDAALMANIMSGPHPLDHNSLTETINIPQNLPGVDNLRIAYSIDMGFHEVANDVRRETLIALKVLADAGALVEELPVDWATEAIRLAHIREEFMFAPEISTAVRDHPDLVSDYVSELAQTALSATADEFRLAQRVAGQVWQDHLGPMFNVFDVLITPTVSSPEIPAENWQKSKLAINGKTVTDTDVAMTGLWNMFGHCPVLAIPSGMTDKGLPTGVQIIGRPYDDVTVFRVGAALERMKPWLDRTDRRPNI